MKIRKEDIRTFLLIGLSIVFICIGVYEKGAEFYLDISGIIGLVILFLAIIHSIYVFIQDRKKQKPTEQTETTQQNLNPYGNNSYLKAIQTIQELNGNSKEFIAAQISLACEQNFNTSMEYLQILEKAGLIAVNKKGNVKSLIAIPEEPQTVKTNPEAAPISHF